MGQKTQFELRSWGSSRSPPSAALRVEQDLSRVLGVHVTRKVRVHRRQRLALSRRLLCGSMVINGPFRRLKDFVQVGVEVFSHPRQPVDQAMRVRLRLADQDSLTSI